MSTILTRVASLEDLDIILSLESNSMPHPWPAADIKSLLIDDNKLAIVASCSDNSYDAPVPCGYVGASWVIVEAEIGNICVDESYRRKGIARKILMALREELKSHGVTVVFLEVDENNSGAISLYEGIGFTRYSVRKGYYSNGGVKSDALLYRWEI